MTRKDLLLLGFSRTFEQIYFHESNKSIYISSLSRFQIFFQKKNSKFGKKKQNKNLEKMKNLGAPMFTIYLLQWPLCYLADLLITLVEEVGTPISLSSFFAIVVSSLDFLSNSFLFDFLAFGDELELSNVNLGIKYHPIEAHDIAKDRPKIARQSKIKTTIIGKEQQDCLKISTLKLSLHVRHDFFFCVGFSSGT